MKTLAQLILLVWLIIQLLLWLNRDVTEKNHSTRAAYILASFALSFVIFLVLLVAGAFSELTFFPRL